MLLKNRLFPGLEISDKKYDFQITRVFFVAERKINPWGEETKYCLAYISKFTKSPHQTLHNLFLPLMSSIKNSMKMVENSDLRQPVNFANCKCKQRQWTVLIDDSWQEKLRNKSLATERNSERDWSVDLYLIWAQLRADSDQLQFKIQNLYRVLSAVCKLFELILLAK